MNTFNLPNHEISLKAIMLLKRFKKLQAFAMKQGIRLPADYYSQQGNTFFCSLEIIPRLNHQYRITKILEIPYTERSFTREDMLSREQQWLDSLEHAALGSFTMELEECLIKAGGLKIGEKIIAFHGRTPHENVALAILLTYQSSQMSAAEFMDLKKKINNPYLENEILDFLLLTVPKQGIYFTGNQLCYSIKSPVVLQDSFLFFESVFIC